MGVCRVRTTCGVCGAHMVCGVCGAYAVCMVCMACAVCRVCRVHAVCLGCAVYVAMEVGTETLAMNEYLREMRADILHLMSLSYLSR